MADAPADLQNFMQVNAEGEIEFDPDLILRVAEARAAEPGLFVSAWDEDEEGIGDPTRDPNSKNTRLLEAAEAGDLPGVDKLLHEMSQHEIINCKDCDGYTPLHRAAQYDHIEVVERLLLAALPLAHTCTCDGWTPAHCAARWGSTHVLATILKVPGFNVNAASDGRLTPLQLAASSTEPGSVACATLLLAQPGIDSSIVSNGGETAVQLARGNSRAMCDAFSAHLGRDITKPDEPEQEMEQT